MNQEEFLKAYNQSRNGANAFYFNRLYPNFQYSDGVRECAQAGCYWLLDILGTELPKLMRERHYLFMVVTVSVSEGQAHIKGDFEDMETDPYTKYIEYTDMPDGNWVFYIAYSGHDKFNCYLPSEH